VAEIREPRGGAGAAALAVALDVLGGNLALEAVAPDWAVTSSLELHRLRPTAGGDVTVRGRPLRAGRTHVVIDAEVAGQDPDAPAAVGSVTFTRIARRSGTPEYRMPDEALTVFAVEGSGLERPLREALGIRASSIPDAGAGADDGALELDVHPWVSNSVGALQGGALVALVDAAATDAAAPRLAEVASPATLDLRVHFLALARKGPVRARARLLGHSTRDARLRVDLSDAGQEGRLVASAFVRVGTLASSSPS